MEFNSNENVNTTSQNKMRISYIVDKVNSQYKNIQDAINHAENNNVNADIKVSSGLYQENILITKTNIKIEPLDHLSEVFIMGSNGPTITVNLNDMDNQVNIQGIKLMHKGSTAKNRRRNKSNKIVKENDNNKLIDIKNNIFLGIKNQLLLEEDKDAIVVLLRGKLILQKCFFSLNGIKVEPLEVPCALKLYNGFTWVLDCDIKGHKYFNCCGVFSRNSNLIIKRTVIEKCYFGGIASYSNYDTSQIQIFESIIQFNKNFGVIIDGFYKNVSIGNNTFDYNDGSGVIILSNILGDIKKNIFTNNLTAIKIISADININHNVISSNYENAVEIIALNSIINNTIICDNEIFNNNKNGIIVIGDRNKSVIKKNVIYNNKECGIKVTNSAGPNICNNAIYRNIYQGILITNNAYGHIQGNVIKENIKANIAFGGDLSYNVCIIENEISYSRCEGIFMLGSSKSFIYSNNINNNYNGIIIRNSFNHFITNYSEKYNK